MKMTFVRIFSLILTLGIPVVSSGAGLRDLRSAGKLHFNKEGVLFLGSGDGPDLYSIDLRNETPASELDTFNIYGIDLKIARFLGVNSRVLRIMDLAVHPKSKKVYLSVSSGAGKNGAFHLLESDSRGGLRKVSPPESLVSHIRFDDRQEENLTFWDKFPASSLSITHIEFHNGYLYVSGLRSGEFASTLYKMPWPFRGSVEKAQVSYYHAVHDQTESRAPVISHKIISIGQKEYLLAVYTCTPLVLIPLSEIRQGAHIRGKTIAELGYGNNPSDMLTFDLDRGDGMQKYVLINNKNRSASLLKMSDIEAAENLPGITTPSGFNMIGVSAETVPMAGVLHMDLLDSQWLLALRRNIDTGNLDLITMLQGAWLRLSDFISEYNFPDYQYPATQTDKQQFHMMLKKAEGFLP